MKQPPHNSVFLIPVLDKWLFFAPLHKVSALLNAAAAEEFSRGKFSNSSGELADLYQGIASTPVYAPGPLQGEICPSMLGIITTRGCNLGCVYCNFGGPTADWQQMDPRIAVAAIDWMAERLKECGRKHFRVHFFGGEPFISPEIVDIVVHRTRYVCAQKGLEPFFDASTNGVFNKSRCEFVGDYFGGIVLSIDGFKKYHDRNRPGFNDHSTFDIAAETAKRLSATPVNLCLRVCITQVSVNQMEEITRWMCTEFRPVVVNFEPLTPGELPAKAGLKTPDPYDFAVNYVHAVETGDKLGIKVIYAAAEIEKNRISFCPVGTDALIVSLDGRASACYLLPEDWSMRGLDMAVGQFNTDGSVNIDFQALDRMRRLPVDKPLCERCFCQWTCAGGCHVNHSFPGCSVEYGGFCIQTRIITACLLLRDLGYEELVQELLQDRNAMIKLAYHPWDAVAIEGQIIIKSSEYTEELTKAFVTEGMGILG